jgi:hypothetical protein
VHYVGVIVGPNFVVHDGKVVMRPENRRHAVARYTGKTPSTGFAPDESVYVALCSLGLHIGRLNGRKCWPEPRNRRPLMCAYGRFR